MNLGYSGRPLVTTARQPAAESDGGFTSSGSRGVGAHCATFVVAVLGTLLVPTASSCRAAAATLSLPPESELAAVDRASLAADRGPALAVRTLGSAPAPPGHTPMLSRAFAR